MIKVRRQKGEAQVSGVQCLVQASLITVCPPVSHGRRVAGSRGWGQVLQGLSGDGEVVEGSGGAGGSS